MNTEKTKQTIDKTSEDIIVIEDIINNIFNSYSVPTSQRVFSAGIKKFSNGPLLIHRHDLITLFIGSRVQRYGQARS